MPIRLENLRIFVKVAELSSFTRAGAQLGISKARASIRVGELEAELGSRLLQRSTRAVKLTPDGEQFLARAERLVREADELASMFQARVGLRGRVRIDLPVAVARSLVIPRLPEFLALHPRIELFVSSTDRRVNVVREGFDCVLRVGKLRDSGLVARRVGAFSMVNCASPTYLAQRGTPRSLADLDRHLLVHYSSDIDATPPSFEYRARGGYEEWPMKSAITVNSTDAYQAACLAGLGIIQAPRYGVTQSLLTGALVEVLPDHTCEPMPVSLVHAYGRSVPKHVRAVMSFIAGLVAPHCAE